MKRVFNFSPGPSMLPLEVLQKAAGEMCGTESTGQSVMEMSHRSKDFKPIIEKTEQLLRELLFIPDNYKVLFLQGGASLQFSMTPLNLAKAGKKAVFIDTGIWADKAAKEAVKFTGVDVRASSKDRAYTYIPEMPPLQADDAYCHITQNNTIVGTKWAVIPDTGSVPLVSDSSSCILSEPLDVSKFGLIYAGAQKNLGPAGLTLVIIRDDLIGHAGPATPAMLRYDIYAEEASMYNTPPCFSIYIAGLVLEWLKNLGGIPAIAKLNHEKAGLLYQYLEFSKLFYSPVEKPFRSIMNIPFIFNPAHGAADNGEKRAELEKRFLKDALARGLVNLAGHRLVGGMRASIYNAMPLEGVKELIKFMEDFEEAQNV